MTDTQHVTEPSQDTQPEAGAIGGEKTWRADALSAGSYLAAGVWGGAVGGLLVGGVGTRVAMFVLRVTTGREAMGVTSDDEFEMGTLSTATLFLFLFSVALGEAVGILYLISRSWIPGRLRTLAFGVMGATVGGSAILHADGIDFTFLEPVWLAVVMFIAIPAAGAATIARLVERRVQSGERPRARGFHYAPLVGLIALGPVGIGVVAVTALAVVIDQKTSVTRIWTSTPVRVIGTSMLGVWTLIGTAALIKDVSGIFIN